MPTIYTDIDPFCCRVIRARIDDGRLPAGTVIERDIRVVRPDELAGFKQVHLFCGIGGFGLAQRLAGWPEDEPLWTAGVPCQPASTAGKRKGSADARWLWPDFLRLMRECRPVRVLAENVPGFVGLKPHGLDWLLNEMEDAGYQCLPFLVGAFHVGAKHRRYRVWIACELADAKQQRRSALRHAGDGIDCRCGPTTEAWQAVDPWSRGSSPMAHPDQPRTGERPEPPRRAESGDCRPCQLADSPRERTQGDRTQREQEPEVRAGEAISERDGGGNRWPARPGERQHEWEKPRLAQFAVGGAVDGLPGRLARRANKQGLKAMGNAIVPQVAAEIMKAWLA